MNDLRARAHQIFCLSEPSDKAQHMHQLWLSKAQWSIQPDWQASASQSAQPLGRPSKPALRPHTQVPKRKLNTRVGLAALLHALCHIEFNAINLALDAIWRFSHMPQDYYEDWARVAHEETLHFEMLQDLLHRMGFAYGDFDAHDGLWQMCEKTQHNVTARMALVPRTLEARGLDASPLIHEKLLHLNDPHAQEAAGILEIILRDEITHVQVGNRWFLWLCEREKISPFETFERLCIQHQAPRMKPPFNVQARLAAGFTPEDIQALIEQER